MSQNYSLKDFKWSSHNLIAGLIEKSGAQKVLDVGCDQEFLGKVLKRRPKYLIGIDKQKIKTKYYYQIFRKDVEKDSFSFLSKWQFEMVVLADVIEHLKSPDQIINDLKPFLKEGGLFIISVPNMSFFLARILNFLKIKPKMSKGLFDKTHLHNFTEDSLIDLLNRNKLQVVKKKYAPLPLPLISSQFKSGGYFHSLYKLMNFLSNSFPSFFSYQIIVIARLK